MENFLLSQVCTSLVEYSVHNDNSGSNNSPYLSITSELKVKREIETDEYTAYNTE